MPKRKRMKNYGNVIRPVFEDTYMNQWTNNQETGNDLKMVSLLLLAEGGSLVQLIVCEDEMYNGIFHLKHFKFNDDKEPILAVDDLDDIHDPKAQNYESLVSQLPELAEKYDIVIPEKFKFGGDPLSRYKEYPKLIME